MKETVQTAVIGVTGYAGAELARLLLHHPRLKGKPPVFAGRVDAKDTARGGIPLGEIHPELADSKGSGTLKQEPFSWELLRERGAEVLFLATPHEQSREWVPEALDRGLKVIDLSGAWRLTEAANRAVYAFEDDGTELAAATQAQAVYGMPELHRKEIAGARLVANPGCYATSVILPLKPLVAAGLVDLKHGIVADAKKRSERCGQGFDRENPLYVCGRQSLSLRSVYASAYRRTAGTGGHYSMRNCFHAAPAPNSAGNLATIYVHFKEPQTRANVAAGLPQVFQGQPNGAAL